MLAEPSETAGDATRFLSVSPGLLGDPATDSQLADLVETAEALETRSRTMFRALERLYSEGILEDPTIRPMRKQREQDAKRLLERYKILLSRYKARRQSAPSTRGAAPEASAEETALSPGHLTGIIGAILIEVDALERVYLHEKVVLKISTDLDAVREELGRLGRIAGDFRGSSVAYGAEEKLPQLRKTEAALERDLRRAELERQVMRMETELLVAEAMLEAQQGDERVASQRDIRVQETQLNRLHDELNQLPARAPTRREPFAG